MWPLAQQSCSPVLPWSVLSIEVYDNVCEHLEMGFNNNEIERRCHMLEAAGITVMMWLPLEFVIGSE